MDGFLIVSFAPFEKCSLEQKKLPAPKSYNQAQFSDRKKKDKEDYPEWSKLQEKCHRNVGFENALLL